MDLDAERTLALEVEHVLGPRVLYDPQSLLVNWGKSHLSWRLALTHR